MLLPRFAPAVFSAKFKPGVRLLWLLTVGLASACTAQVQQPAVNSTAAAEVLALHNVSFNSVLALPVTTPGIRLAYGSDPLQFGLLHLPVVSTAIKPPLIIFVHGGCWLNAYDIGHSQALSQALTEAGFAVWSLEYRRTGDKGGGWPGSLHDIQQGIAYAQSQFAQYPVDLTRVVLMGHSAGGQLALLAAAGQPAQVKAVVGLAAITDMASYAKGGNSCQSATAKFMGATEQQAPELYQQASPAKNQWHPNTLLLQGNADPIVPVSQAAQSGMPYHITDKAGHFDWIHPQTAAYSDLLAHLQELLVL